MTEPFDSLAAYGWNDRWSTLFSTAAEGREGLTPGRVVRHDGVAVMVATPDGVRQLPVFATVEPQPVVGDWVVCSHEAVVATLHRSSLLRRRDPGRPVEQPLVANVDVVLVVCGLDRPVRAGTGIDVVVTSTVTGQGVDDLRERTAGRTIVLLGESGAGKSSLTNALVGTDVAVVGAVRASDTKGRHTTTTREIHLLPSGGVLVDTPGVRALGLWTDPDAVAATFEDLEELAESCHFSDCRHQGEPGCAIALAVEAGEVAPERLEAWLTLRREAEALARRNDPPAQRAHNKRFSRVAKDAVRRKNRDDD